MKQPLVIELFSGTFGWSHGWLARGGRAVGFDIEHLPHHGPVPDGAELVLQDVRTLDGAQFKDAALILASPPCQEFSWRAMPWKKAREAPPPVLGMELFDACFRIQREASAAAGRHIPLVVENVRGAQKWVGRAPHHFGSFYLCGDVPVLMPKPHKARKNNGGSWFNIDSPGQKVTGANPVHEGTKVAGFRFDGSGRSSQSASVTATPHRRISEAWRAKAYCTRAAVEGMKQPGLGGTRHGSKSTARKAASALIASIPERLSDWIAEVYFPKEAKP